MGTQQKQMLSYTAVIAPNPEGGYDVSIPALPECDAHGKSIEDARKNAIEAVQEHLEWLGKAGERLPHDLAPEAFSEKTKVEVESRSYTFTTIYEPAVEGGYIAYVPALNGATTEGNSLSQAREMARDMIAAYLESLLEHDEAVPGDIGKSPRIEKITLSEPAVTA